MTSGTGSQGGKEGSDQKYTITAKYTPYSTDPATDPAQGAPQPQPHVHHPPAPPYVHHPPAHPYPPTHPYVHHPVSQPYALHPQTHPYGPHPASQTHAHGPQTLPYAQQPASQPHAHHPQAHAYVTRPVQYVQPVQYIQPVHYVQPVQYVQRVQYAPHPRQIDTYSFPGGDAGPLYIGATTGHDPIPFTCPQCNHNGRTRVKKKAGWGYGMWIMMTFGLGLLCDGAKDTHHYCPNCNRHLAYSKFM